MVQFLNTREPGQHAAVTDRLELLGCDLRVVAGGQQDIHELLGGMDSRLAILQLHQVEGGVAMLQHEVVEA